MLLQVFGSAFILIAFILAQIGLLKASSLIYLFLNAIGSTILALDALHLQQWGFVALEGVWAVVSLIGLLNYFFKKKNA